VNDGIVASVSAGLSGLLGEEDDSVYGFGH